MDTAASDDDGLARQLLAGTLAERDEFRLGHALSRIEAGPPPAAADLTRALQALLGQRLLRLAARLGAHAAQVHPQDLGLLRRWAQARIDLGDLDGADALLAQALADAPADHPERAELRGLQGRAAKQRWVHERQADGLGGEQRLLQALAAYAQVVAEKPARWWHGINTVALCVQAEALQLPLPLDWRTLAARIFKERVADWRHDRKDPQAFGQATAAEAALALGKLNDAELWACRFALSPDATAFSLNSFARQLREVWQVPRTPSGRAGGQRERMLLVVERALAQLGGTFTLQGRADAGYLEKVYNRERYVGYGRWRDALQACGAVARIERASGAGVGTGFVVRGDALHPRLGAGPVLVTNAHVISDDGVDGALPSAEARVRFEVDARADRGYVPLAVQQLLWSSPPAEIGDVVRADSHFDVTLCTLAGPKPPSQLLMQAPRVPLPSAQSRAYIIGHPDGDGLQFSVADSELLAVGAGGKLVHYRTPTVGGSSGSPVFDADWKVYALHHAGSEQAPSLVGGAPGPANEGITLHAIRAALQRLWGS